MTDLTSLTPDFLPGQVWLVGAGPGDPGLLTLHAINALQAADVIVYDALVDQNCLALAREGAVLEFAGKRGGKPSPKQRDITLKLIAYANQGKRVLRLKGGDPFVFGRGGEEALALVEAGIPFRIVPGITAGIGGLAYAGIPATHRETNHVVSFLTGHDSSGIVPDTIDWESLAKSSPVIIMYMAIKHMDTITTRLIEAGRLADEPVAIVTSAATTHQRVLVSTLGNIVADLAREGLEPPAIFVVGEVVRLRAGLDWLGALDPKSGIILDPDPLKQKIGALKAG